MAGLIPPAPFQDVTRQVLARTLARLHAKTTDPKRSGRWRLHYAFQARDMVHSARRRGLLSEAEASHALAVLDGNAGSAA